jgi:hypothetical protein
MDRKARITEWEAVTNDLREVPVAGDAYFVTVAYTRVDGQRCEADFRRIGWIRPPKEVLDGTMRALIHTPVPGQPINESIEATWGRERPKPLLLLEPQPKRAGRTSRSSMNHP